MSTNSIPTSSPRHPKTFEKNKHYFQGKIWVDQQDFQIVLINGKTVPQDTRKGHEDLQPPFTTYYEQVDGKYWFPTYTKAEGNLHFVGGDGPCAGRPHAQHRQVHRLQAVPRLSPHHLQRPGHHQQQSTRRQGHQHSQTTTEHVATHLTAAKP